MKFISLKENLKQGLNIVSHLSSKNISLPILNNILIKAKKEGLELMATNLEISVNHFLRGKVEQEGEIIIDSKLINEYINLLPEDKVEAQLKDGELNITCKNYKTKIKTQVSNDFPILPSIDNSNFYELNFDDFKNSLSEVFFAVSFNESRPELSGILFSFQENELILVGTDSYRLSEKKIKLKNKKSLGKKDLIIPLKTAQELFRILSNFKNEDQINDSDVVKINFSDNHIFFSFGTTNISSKLVLGKYPDYQQIIPKTEKYQIEIEKTTLVRAVKSAGIFSKTGINDISISVNNGKVVVSSSSSQTGENNIYLDANIKGDGDEILFNYKYLLDGLNNIKSDQIIIKVIDNNNPIIIKSKEFDDFLYIMMPIRQ